ncbi:hypothetical protein [Sphingomonas swuensis]
MEKALNWALWDRIVPPSLVELNHINWEQHDYATQGDQQFTVWVEYRNRSPLQLVGLSARYRLYDCMGLSTCLIVDTQDQAISMLTQPGYRGRFQGSFIVRRMVDPRGHLRIEVRVLSATGQDSKEVACAQNDQN